MSFFKKLILGIAILQLPMSQALENAGNGVEVKIRLSEQLPQDIIAMYGSISQGNDSVLGNLGESLKKVTPGIDSIGGSLRSNLANIGSAMVDTGKQMKEQLLEGSLGMTAIIAGGILLTVFGIKYIKKQLLEPSLIEKKSARGITGFLSLFFKNSVDLKEHMVISPALQTELEYVMATTKNIKKNGGEFENILLYGPPGTGKTLFAQLLAEHCGMDYAIVPAANVSQFLANDKAVEELNNLFAWAAKSSKGTVIFFDEAETFLADRSTLGLAAQNALSAFLAKTGTPSHKIMIICATNRPEIIDDAALSRLGLQVKFELPDQATREKILTMHIEKTFKKQQGKVVNYALLQQQSTVANIATELNNCSGRTLQKGINRLRQLALSQDKSNVDQAIIDAVVHQIKNDKRFK